MNSIELPKIIAADMALEQIRRYKPEGVVKLINNRIETFIKTITDIRNAKTKINITEYISGYSMSEIKALIKALINAYETKGYIIKYSVYYHTERYRNPEYRLKIKHIKFNKLNTKFTPHTQDAPPSYSETVENGLKRFICL